MRILFFTATLMVTFSLSACSSLHSKLRRLQIGMIKRQVLSKFGEPIEKGRSNGQDHWIYETQKRAKHSKDSILYRHKLIFENGILIDNQVKRSFTTKELKNFYETD